MKNKNRLSQITSVLFILISFALGFYSKKAKNKDLIEWIIVISFILFLMAINILINRKSKKQDHNL